MWDLLDARRAICGPKIEDDGLALQIGEFLHTAVLIGPAHFAERFHSRGIVGRYRLVRDGYRRRRGPAAVK